MAPASFLEKLRNITDSAADVDSLLQDVAKGVCAREVTLQEVVEGLGPSLTHQKSWEREVGTRFLARLLDKLPPTYLNPAEASFMAAFLVNRLQDHHAVLPAVFLCSLALVKQKNLGDAEVQSILEGIFGEAQVQSHVTKDRQTVFLLLKYCLANRLTALKEMGLPLLSGLIGAIDGERDPRNLLLVFSLVAEVVHSGLALQPFVEELFEVVAAYFPIDFVPPRNDPYGIQAEDLVLGLRAVLASTPAFAPFFLPLLMEKVDSSLTSAKLDSLHTLVACCDVYKAEDLQPHASLLWVSLRREVMEGSDRTVEEAALSALTAVVRVLEVGLTTSASHAAVASIVQSALAECGSHLEAPEQRLMWPSVRLLMALVLAAPGPATTILGKVVPQLVRQSVKQDGSNSPLALQNTISALAMILEAAAKHSHLVQEDGLLTQLAGQVWESFSSGLSSADPQVQATTLTALPAALPALPSSYLQQAATQLTALLLDPSTSTSSSRSLKEGIRTCLVRLGKHNPEVILNHTLPPLLATLHSGSEAATREAEEQVLESLVSLTTSRRVLASLLPEVWSRAEALLADGGEERCHLYLSAVDKMVSSRVEDAESQRFLLEEWKGTECILALFSGLARKQPSAPHLPGLLCLASTLRTLVALESQPQPLIHQLVCQAVGVTKDCTEGMVASDMPLLPNTSPDMKDLLATSLDHTHPNGPNMLYVLEGLVGGAQRLPEEDDCMLSLLKKVRVFSTSTADPALREVAVLLHAATLNKLPEGAQLSQAEEEARTDTEADLDSAQPNERRLAALNITTWTCKALVVRGSNLQHWWTMKLLSLMKDPQLGVPAARCLEMIVKEHPHALRQHYHARIRLLHKQRFFEGVVGPLVETFSSSQGSPQSCCLVALCSLLPHLSQLILAPHVQKVLPVVLQGLASDGEQVVVESVVGTLASLLKHSPDPATSHLSFLLPALLRLTSNQPMTVRMKALECLDALATLPTTPILPYRDDVLQGLKAVLDDHKRVVRQAATNTRSTWVMVGVPGGS
ncbi:MMS19 nucleotide excision repair protein homolog [Eriocheir sinensis]|uniref:MMS19 nucleotide excision repair protein homolog n=1 Tax=Eriocheir sinensis TaxID=95602 RepID=UPI0021C7BDFB|nr:MMS19 nucleotide excision repair protein homolog [Eriocheir sinensis]